jgi:organic radical activating enzyme
MTSLRVLEIFDSLQGEGYWTGVPMTFVRLAGCNAPGLGLGCTQWCDTPSGWALDAGEEWEIGEIVDRVHLPRLCLTGGEPLLQVEGLTEVVAEAHRREIRVHLETNGSIGPLPVLGWSPGVVGAAAGQAGAPADAAAGFDWAVVSPKPPDYLIAPGWEGLVDELKLVVDQQLDAATAERLAAAHPEAFVSIQPEYGAGRTGRGLARESSRRAVALVMDHPEWRLSLQTHKLLGIR